MPAKDAKRLDFSFIASGDVKGTTILKNNLVIFHKMKHTLNTWTCNYTLVYLPQRIENLCSRKHLYLNVKTDLLVITKRKTGSDTKVFLWLNKFWFIRKIEHYSEKKLEKKNELLIYATTLINFKVIMLLSFSTRQNCGKGECRVKGMLWGGMECKYTGITGGSFMVMGQFCILFLVMNAGIYAWD